MNQKIAKEAKRLFSFMHVVAWLTLAIGVGVVLWSFLAATDIGELNDRNSGLMIGVGFMVGSVFIYTIGTFINMVENRKSEHSDK